MVVKLITQLSKKQNDAIHFEGTIWIFSVYFQD